MLRTTMILIILCLSLVTATRLRDLYPEIKASAEGWEVAHPDELPYADMTLEELAAIFPNNVGSLPRTSTYFKPEPQPKDPLLESHFDARVKWPDCIHKIRDQGQCGSCYAHGTTGVLSDRLCIHSNGTINVDLSPQYGVSCGLSICNGCGGCPYPYSWLLLEWYGTVSEECFPYKGQVTSCPSEPKCANESAKFEKYYIEPWSTVYTYMDIQAIKKEIMANGPVAAAIFYTIDYFYYKGGIFTGGTHGLLSTHLVKLIGWGVGEIKGQPVEYWLVQDSQGERFGERGYSKIMMGALAIDSHVSWARPLLKPKS